MDIVGNPFLKSGVIFVNLSSSGKVFSKIKEFTMNERWVVITSDASLNAHGGISAGPGGFLGLRFFSSKMHSFSETKRKEKRFDDPNSCSNASLNFPFIVA